MKKPMTKVEELRQLLPPEWKMTDEELQQIIDRCHDVMVQDAIEQNAYVAGYQKGLLTSVASEEFILADYEDYKTRNDYGKP